jgi:hypothetical protein
MHFFFSYSGIAYLPLHAKPCSANTVATSPSHSPFPTSFPTFSRAVFTITIHAASLTLGPLYRRIMPLEALR